MGEQSAPLTADWRYLIEHESGDSLDSPLRVENPLDVESWPELRARVFPHPDEIGCSLDRLTVTGDVRDLVRFQHWLDTEPVLGARVPSQQPYKWAHSLVGGLGYLQYGDARQGGSGGSGERIRYDFNPATVTVPQAHAVIRHIAERRVSRIDVAVDYPRDLSRLLFDRPRCSRTVYTGADGATETVYLGAPGSKLRHRCYDKARERAYTGQYVEPDALWWRVEAVWRPVGEDQLLPESLFGSLVALGPTATMSGHWRDYGAVHYAREHPEWLRRLHWRHRKTVTEALEGCFRTLDPHPDEVYKRVRFDLLDQVHEYVFRA